jgi:hypothetical protein
MRTRRILIVGVAILLLIVAYRFNRQPRDQVLVRDPGNRMYKDPAPVAVEAVKEREYAILAANVYVGKWGDTIAATSQSGPAMQESNRAACADRQRRLRMPLAGWHPWQQFPSAALVKEAEKTGLYFEAWETDAASPQLAVVFRGTDGWNDWFSNLRWFFWLTRFIPGYEDQYHMVSRMVGDEFSARVKENAARYQDAKEPKLVSVGHSLGGGLAQHFAYSLKPADRVPKVSHVYAFDPSPVTGWSTVDTTIREKNRSGLNTDRVFEHGEILAYIRLVISYVMPPSAINPAITEIRYNFKESFNPFSSHSMRDLACDLTEAGGLVAATTP